MCVCSDCKALRGTPTYLTCCTSKLCCVGVWRLVSLLLSLVQRVDKPPHPQHNASCWCSWPRTCAITPLSLLLNNHLPAKGFCATLFGDILLPCLNPETLSHCDNDIKTAHSGFG